jgi:hypothetical protein
MGKLTREEAFSILEIEVCSYAEQHTCMLLRTPGPLTAAQLLQETDDEVIIKKAYRQLALKWCGPGPG